jgi:hypothetical protein
LLTFVMRFGFGYRIRNVRELRRRYREIRSEHPGPILICGNHLTMIDSALITWALGSSSFYIRHFSALPWNLPERRNFASIGVNRVLVYLLKCIPIVRGGKRAEIGHALESVEHLLSIGEPVMIFPEAGRSRTGRVSTEAPAHGVGRVVSATPGCKVLCVYLRGDAQDTWSSMPARGDTFTIQLSLLTPSSELTGMRRSRAIAQQVIAEIAALEERYLAEYAPRWAQEPVITSASLSEHP